jgi:predicted GNAT family acetyltransferase
VAQDLLAAGALVMLFADAANPGSNRVYERLGFAVAGEQVELDLL